jgi:hypothetical protein
MLLSVDGGGKYNVLRILVFSALTLVTGFALELGFRALFRSDALGMRSGVQRRILILCLHLVVAVAVATLLVRYMQLESPTEVVLFSALFLAPQLSFLSRMEKMFALLQDRILLSVGLGRQKEEELEIRELERQLDRAV